MSESAYWYVWNMSGHRPQHKHWSRKSAIKEAERLATINEGERFYVLMVEGSAQKPKPEALFVQFYDDSIPF